MKKFIGMALIGTLVACGPSEEEIRADERAQMLEERVAELEAEKDEATAQRDDAETAEATKAPKEGADSADEGSLVENADAPSMQRIASYNAFIGQSDLFNSDGKRLTAPWQVLRQDRANFHRYSISQSGDQSDPFFSSAKNRAIMERMVANGTIERSAGRRILNGDVSVRVEIFGNGSTGQRVNVTVR